MARNSTYNCSSWPAGLTTRTRLFSASIPDSDALADYLLTQAHIGVTPGSGFGAPNHIRLSYACSQADIEKGMARLADYFRRLGV